MRIHFKTDLKRCPSCFSPLRAYKNEYRTIRSISYGEFIAIHHIMLCRNHPGILYRSERLSSIIGPYRTYANDVMVESALKRFIEGRSCSEIARDLNIGISDSHVRLLSNTALEIFGKIHEENVQKLRSAMGSYILQIDGTVDSEFSMIVVVSDSISGFVLKARKCNAESYDEIRDILQQVKYRFGNPSGIISDMRSGILSAIEETFPDIPHRVCLLHFLRDIGNDLMKDLHLSMGKAINGIGIKSALKEILGSIPDYDQMTLYEIEQGYCTDREKMEIMAVKRILERLLGTTGSSGYGFPFSLRHLNFYLACREAEKELNSLRQKIDCAVSTRLLSGITALIIRVTGDDSITDKATKLSDINRLFQRMRNAFRMPEKGNMSDDIPDDNVRESCDLIIEGMNVYLHANIPNHIFKAAKHIISKYEQRKFLLFANNSENTIPRTNNGIERFFRKVRRNVRKRCGNIATGSILSHSGESLAIFQNMGNLKYVSIVFGSSDIPSHFARYRKRIKRNSMTRSRIVDLVERGTKMLLSDSLPGTPYTPEFLKDAYASLTTIPRAQGRGS